MRITIHGPVRDTLAFIGHIRERNRIFVKTNPEPLGPGSMNELSLRLHPGVLRLRIDSLKEETEAVRTYRLIPKEKGEKIPPFRAGQYIGVHLSVDGIRVTRPYSISSSPDEAESGNYYDITVKKQETGFASPFIFRHWKEGSELLCSGPSGSFSYEPLRDGARVVCLAGGTGITPFRSIITDSLAHEQTEFVLFYGANCQEELLFLEDFEALGKAYPKRFTLIPVCVDADGWTGESGFLSGSLIRKAVPKPEEACYFICGPEAMKAYLAREMAGWGLRPRQVREERSEAAMPSAGVGWEEGSISIEVLIDGERTVIPALRGETVLAALERAGLNPPSLCRSGDCGWCRSRVIAGSFSVPGEGCRVRKADEKFGCFHPCISYPVSDMIISVPRNPI